MKKFFVVILTIVLLTPLQMQAQGREQLKERLSRLLTLGYMCGHQDDPFYGLTWEWEYGRSDVKETCGDYPAVMGFELGGIELGDQKNLDSVPFTRMHDEIILHHRRGGIVTISWHPRNPLTGGTAWDVSDTTVVQSILPGGNMHRKFTLWMKNVKDFLQTLKDKEDQPIPIIFRPWHENNGSWFWWGEKLCSAEEYKALWNMLQDYLRGEGMDNLLWSYSPNLDGNFPEEKFLERYPGDDRVELLGLDAYQWGTEEDFIHQINDNLRMLTNYCAQHDKLLALTECGLKNLPDPTWWTRVLKPQMDKYPICYFLFWRNAKHEYFGPAPGKKNAFYFNDLVHSSNVLLLQDIKNRK